MRDLIGSLDWLLTIAWAEEKPSACSGNGDTGQKKDDFANTTSGGQADDHKQTGGSKKAQAK